MVATLPVLSALNINKRQKMIVSGLILSAGLLGTQFIPFYFRYHYILGLTAASYFLSLWSLWEGMSKLKAVILLILPSLFTLAVASYYYLILPLWMRVFVSAIFGLLFYTLLLSQNIFNVSSIRTIPLYRVASTVVFVLTIVTASLLFVVIYSLQLMFIWNGLLVFLLSFPLVLQIVWTVQMEKLTGLLLVYSLIVSLVMAEIGMGLSFWPASKGLISVVLTSSLYITLGISLEALKDRLNREVIFSFLKWVIPVLLIVTLATSWRG